MSVETLKLLRPQTGDIVIVDYNKVNVTMIENAVIDLKVSVIAVGDIDKVQIFGMREQKDFSVLNAQLQIELDKALAEITRLMNVIKFEMVPKPAPAIPVPATSTVGTTTLPTSRPKP